MSVIKADSFLGNFDMFEQEAETMAKTTEVLGTTVVRFGTEVFESAYLDGASEIWWFFQIALPVVKPIIAAMALYYGVARWNEFSSTLLFVNNPKYQPLQLVFCNILLMNQNAAQNLNTAPMLIAYPFVQKHFVKGVMIGSLKG